MKGKVYIASMNMRGKRAIAPYTALSLNVTSAQAKTNKNRRDFSPMTAIDDGYNGFWKLLAIGKSV